MREGPCRPRRRAAGPRARRRRGDRRVVGSRTRPTAGSAVCVCARASTGKCGTFLFSAATEAAASVAFAMRSRVTAGRRTGRLAARAGPSSPRTRARTVATSSTGKPLPGGHSTISVARTYGRRTEEIPVCTATIGTSARVAARMTCSSSRVAAPATTRTSATAAAGSPLVRTREGSPPAPSSRASWSARTPVTSSGPRAIAALRVEPWSASSSRGPMPSALIAGGRPRRGPGRGSPGGCRSQGGSPPSTSRPP